MGSQCDKGEAYLASAVRRPVFQETYARSGLFLLVIMYHVATTAGFPSIIESNKRLIDRPWAYDSINLWRLVGLGNRGGWSSLKDEYVTDLIICRTPRAMSRNCNTTMKGR